MSSTIREAANTCALAVIKAKTVQITGNQARDTCAITINVTAPAPSADFNTRKTAPGVVRWFDFDTTAQLGENALGRNFGYASNSGDPLNLPVIDATIKASGTGSLRFDVRSQSFSDGQWYANYSSDLSVRFGENTEHFVQWRQRFNQAFVDTLFLLADGSHQGGIKQAIVGPGDTATVKYGSCEAIHNVIQTFYQWRFPIGYNSCTGSGTHPAYSGYYETTPGGDYNFENAMPSPYCLRSTTLPVTEPASPAGCFGWVANEWMTFQVGITLGPRNNVTNDFDNSRFRLWGARENQPSQLLIDWKPGVGGYFPLAAGPLSEDQKFGKVWFLPYLTNKDPNQVTPLCQTWYDELIISTNKIADPLPSSTAPAWLQGKTKDTLYSITGTDHMSGYTWKLPNNSSTTGIVNAWQGYAKLGTKWYAALAAGHSNDQGSEWQNPVLQIDFSATAPAWAVVDAGSDYSSAPGAMFGARYYDGRPCSRHTYYSTQIIPAAYGGGVDRIVMPTCFNPYAQFLGGYTGGPITDSFRLDTNTWDAAATFDDTPWFPSAEPSVAMNPSTGIIYLSADYTCASLNPTTRHWTILQGAPGFRETGMESWNDCASLVDVSRNVLVGVVSSVYVHPGQMVLERMNLTTLALDQIVLTGTLPTTTRLGGFVHDLDNDRYLYIINDNSASTPLISISPTTGVCTAVPGVSIPLCMGAPCGRMAYFQSLGCIVYLPQFTSSILFMPTR